MIDVKASASIDDNPLELAPIEFQLLQFFMSHPERVYSRQELIDRVWGTTSYVEDRTIDVHIRRLRMALEPHDQKATVPCLYSFPRGALSLTSTRKACVSRMPL